MEHESDVDTNSNWYARYKRLRVDTGTGELGKKEDEWRPSKLMDC